MRYKATRDIMIGRLTGRVEDEADSLDLVVLDVQGVGYEVTVPLGTIGRAPRTDTGLVTLFIHTHVREDALALFGFASETDRITFRLLIGISNVGPKTAITVLSVLPAEDLTRAVAHGDLGRLTSIPGVGKKTAERLVLELKDKLSKKVAAATSPTPPQKPMELIAQSDVLRDALIRMGYRPAEADRAVSTLQDRVGAQPIGQSVREALALLAK
jgi:holliday junction DNA helicase RuvA